MKVRELIEKLESMDGDMEVKFSYDYGDHWHSQVAEDVRTVDEAEVQWSEYHRMDKVADEDSEQDDDSKIVVLISG